MALACLVPFILCFHQLGYFVTGKVLWSTKPVTNYTALLQHAYPIGNGRLAALPFGEPGYEKLSLNRDTLWSGGPFANTSYRGGNPLHERYHYLPGIRDWIWQNGTGNVSKLMGDTNDYGSYQVLANLTVLVHDIESTNGYERSLNLRNGIHSTTFLSRGASYRTETYCSHPDDVCVYQLTSSDTLPDISISMEQIQMNASLISRSCSTGQVRLTGTTEVDPGFKPDLSMEFDSMARIVGQDLTPKCDSNTLIIPRGRHKTVSLILAAGTDYEETHGNSEYDYSFRGANPEIYVQNAVDAAAKKGDEGLRASHVSDYATLANAFTLNLPDTANSSCLETEELIKRYGNPNTTALGDPYLESLMFAYGRHLFICASRANSLPPNLQGKWANALENAWGSDYHANINLQMNHWLADQTGLGALQAGLWNYMAQTWAPRGSETAKLLYNASGWVVHNEMNIFGYSGMKTGDDIWADYPASAAWMMQHVWDHFDYSQDVDWLKRQGYAKLLKPITQFWLSQLQEDQHFKDGTLVVIPCSSPEHGPTTFGCTHWQQLIYQVFDTALASAPIVGETDEGFLSEVEDKLARLDEGLHIGRWGQVQEWKLDFDVKNDTHRHLSELVGWHPGWAISSYLGGYTNKTIQDAVETTLYSRGVGIGPDANSGWEKVWRSGCWARLNNSMKAYDELRLAIYENWAPNGLSMYSGKELPFQIDANFGFGGAVLSMLIVDLPLLHNDDSVRTVILGPAIPVAWGGGSVTGLRLRGGGSVDFSWDMEGVVTEARVSVRSDPINLVNKDGLVL